MLNLRFVDKIIHKLFALYLQPVYLCSIFHLELRPKLLKRAERNEDLRLNVKKQVIMKEGIYLSGTAVSAGTSAGVARQVQRPQTCWDTPRSRYAGTPYGLLLSAVERGDRRGLYESIDQIEGQLRQARRIMDIRKPTRSQLLSFVQGFLRSSGLSVDRKILLGYRHSARRSVSAMV